MIAMMTMMKQLKTAAMTATLNPPPSALSGLDASNLYPRGSSGKIHLFFL